MLGLAEYSVLQSELWQTALDHQQKINDALVPGVTKQQAINIATEQASEYQTEYKTMLRKGLEEITGNAVDYYQMQLEFDVKDVDSVIQDLVGNAYDEPYYGATLKHRLKTNDLRLMRNITKSALWGTEYEGLRRFLTHPIPYGSQYNFDKRILLAQASKLEQDTAKVMGDEADVTLVKWNTSMLHPKPDICDDYATFQSPDVSKYIEKNKLDLSPKGVYFLKDLPHPPHPNCMCEYGLVTGKRTTGGPVKRSLSKIRSLLQRFRRK